jgi:AcrR family transcriptional regulator
MTTPALRADAQRNLGRVLDAAAEVLAEQGMNASVDEIARRAGVGHGTVFRRFPTKEALVAAVVCKSIDEVAASAEGLLDDPDAGEAFEAFVWQIAEVYARHRGIFEAMPRCAETGEIVESKSRFLEVVTQVVSRAQAQGAIRPDLAPEDVPVLVGSAILGSTWSPEGEPWRRYVAVVLDGMRAMPVTRP